MENEETQKVIKLCSDYLGNVWTDSENIDIKRVCNGYGNHTYHCSIKDGVDASKYYEVKHKNVIVRLYGSDLFEDKSTMKFNCEAGEALTLHILSKHGIAPKLLGVFSGGMIVEYIPSRVSTIDDWKDKDICVAFARKVALMHTVSIPITKRPQLLEKVAIRRQTVNKECVDFSKFPASKHEQMKTILNFPVEEEYRWIQTLAPKIGHKVVFSQNDLNPNNILVKHEYSSLNDRLVFVDYELCTYYYRGYDLAQFLTMKNLRHEHNEGNIRIWFVAEEDNARDVIINEYLNESRRLNPGAVDDTRDTFDHLSMEVDFFQLVFTNYVVGMFHAMFSTPQKIDYPYDMPVQMINSYPLEKQTFLDKYGECIQ